MSPCIPIKDGYLCVPYSPVTFRYHGDTYLMEWHPYGGPFFVRADGSEDDREIPQPVWDAVSAWQEANTVKGDLAYPVKDYVTMVDVEDKA